MKRAYHFHYPIQPEAHSDGNPIHLSQGKVRTWQLESPNYLVEKLDFEVFKNFNLSYEAHTSHYLLFFMLEGNVSITTESGIFLSKAKAGQMAFVHHQAGQYLLPFSAGKYSTLCIRHRENWHSVFSMDNSHLSQFIQEVPSARHSSLPFCRMDRTLTKWLKKLLSLDPEKSNIEPHLSYSIGMMLAHYKDLAAAKRLNPAWTIKRYLDAHFMDQNLSLSELSRRLDIGPESLRTQFRTEFHVSPHFYYTAKRMEMAQELIRSQGLSLGQTFHRVGYKDEATFRYQLKKFGI
jgi:AraC-like DNA-binding protein